MPPVSRTLRASIRSTLSKQSIPMTFLRDQILLHVPSLEQFRKLPKWGQLGEWPIDQNTRNTQFTRAKQFRCWKRPLSQWSKRSDISGKLRVMRQHNSLVFILTLREFGKYLQKAPIDPKLTEVHPSQGDASIPTDQPLDNSSLLAIGFHLDPYPLHNHDQYPAIVLLEDKSEISTTGYLCSSR